MSSSYFGARFLTNEHRFLFTTDDTAVQQLIKKSEAIPSTLLATEGRWESEAEVAETLALLSNGNPALRRLVLIGHHESGEVTIRYEAGERQMPIATLQRIAGRVGLELLVWGCESAEFASGGIPHPFREKVLIAAINKALSQGSHMTFGQFLNATGEGAGVRFVFDAVKALTVEQVRAVVRDAAGNEQEVDMPRMPRPVQSSSTSVTPASVTSLVQEDVQERSWQAEVAEFLSILVTTCFYSGMFTAFIVVVTAVQACFATAPRPSGDELSRELLFGLLYLPLMIAAACVAVVSLWWILVGLFGASHWAVSLTAVAVLVMLYLLHRWVSPVVDRALSRDANLA